MSTDREKQADVEVIVAPEGATLHVYEQLIEHNGLYLLADVECKAVSDKLMHLTLSAKTGEVSLSLPCGCRTAISLGAMVFKLQQHVASDAHGASAGALH